jgi:hypothetical protein
MGEGKPAFPALGLIIVRDRGWQARVGVGKRDMLCVWSPSPSSPPARGGGFFWVSSES